MSDLRISYAELESAKASMTRLSADFNNIQTQESEYNAAFGSPSVIAAMGSFAGNWTDHRQKIESQMNNLTTMLSKALTDFPRTDQQYAAELRKH